MAYKQTCMLTCTNNDQLVKGEVIDFRQGSRLTISLERQIKLTLKFDAHRNHYHGSMSGYEFVTTGPKEISEPNRRR